MTRVLDLSDVINNRDFTSRLEEGLWLNWEWQWRSRHEAVVRTAAERRYLRRQYAADLGVYIDFDGD